MRSAPVWFAALLPAVLVTTSCNPRPPVASDIDPTGTYALVSMGGTSVPGMLQHGNASVSVKHGSFVIMPDGTCLSRIVFSLPSGQEAVREVKATYTRQGATLTMRWEGAGTTIGTVDGNTFSMNNEGVLFVYRK